MVKLDAISETGRVSLSSDSFGHLLSCLANQKYVGESPPNGDALAMDEKKYASIQNETQAAIDDFYHQCYDFYCAVCTDEGNNSDEEDIPVSEKAPKCDYYDSGTGLEWIACPLNSGISWKQADSWAKRYGSAYRMPTEKELLTLYKKGLGDRNVPPELGITAWDVWTGDVLAVLPNYSMYYGFYLRTGQWIQVATLENMGALAVRKRLNKG